MNDRRQFLAAAAGLAVGAAALDDATLAGATQFKGRSSARSIPVTPTTTTTTTSSSTTTTTSGTAAAAPLVACPGIPSLESYGHSWLTAYGATAAKYGLAERLAMMLGAPDVNTVALTGGCVAGLAAYGAVASLLQNGLATDLTAGPYLASGGLKLCLIGLDDYNVYASQSGGAALVESALTLAYSRLIAAMVIPALSGTSGSPALNSGQLTYSGSGWNASADTTISSPPGFAWTQTSGVSVSWQSDAAYDGEAITVILPVAGGSSTVKLSIDGVTAGTLSTASTYSALIGAGVSQGTVCLRIPAGTAAPGVHTFTVTISAVEGYAQFGGIIVEPTTPPPLIVPLIPPLSGNATEQAGASWSNARNTDVAAAFPSAITVNLAPALSPTYPSTADLRYWSQTEYGHPNNLGYGRCAATLYGPASTALTAAMCGLMS